MTARERAAEASHRAASESIDLFDAFARFAHRIERGDLVAARAILERLRASVSRKLDALEVLGEFLADAEREQGGQP